MCEKREKRLDRSLPRSPRTRSASPPDARASPHAATWPVSGINSQLLREGLPSTEQCHTVANLDIRVRVTRAHPLHELVRGFHGGKARLPNQRPIVEHAGLLDVRQRHGWIQPSAIGKIDHRRFGISGIVAPFREDGSDAYHRPYVAAVIQEDAVARLHGADGFHRLRIGHAIPDGLAVAL